MARRRHSAEEIVAKVRQVDALTAEGQSIAKAIWTVGLSETTYHRWRAKAKLAAADIVPDSAARDDAAPDAANAEVGPGGSTLEEGPSPEDRPTASMMANEPTAPVPPPSAATSEVPAVDLASPAFGGKPVQRRWRNGLLLACLVGGPAIALVAALVALKQVRTQVEDALHRNSASLERLEQQGRASAVAVEGLRQGVALDRDGLAGLRKEVAGAARAQASAAAELERRRTGLGSRLGMLSRDVALEREDIARLRAMTASAKEAQSAAATALERQRAEILARVDALQQAVADYRESVAGLRNEMGDAARAQAAELDRRRIEMTTQLEKLRQDAAASRIELGRLESRLAALPGGGGRATGSTPADLDTASIAPPPGSQENADPARSVASVVIPSAISLPTDASPRVVVRFARDRPRARDRAAKLEQNLRAQGLDVVKSADAAARLRSNSVVYFYAEHRPSAERIAANVATSPPVQRQFSVNDLLPRPGTIEIAIVK